MYDHPVCPEEEVLQRFLFGQFPAAEVERLAGHVESCTRCVGKLQTLHQQDELLQAMATPPAAPPSGHEYLFKSLWALRSVENFCDTDISGGLLVRAGADRSEDTEDDYEYLSPAAEPQELGRLGTYRVLRVLGKGGMGVVFLAEDPHLQRRVALKVLRPGLLTNEAAHQRFLREARAIAGLTHDHIVSILHVGEERGVPFLAMPLLQGETLEARLQREQRLPSAEVLRIGREIADGLAAAHQRSLIHRDIKPANIWLEADTARVKILDFGLARSVGEVRPTPHGTLDTQTVSRAAPDLTQSGVLVGTPAYMAPEQARGEAVDPRCDLFSLGAVLYRMCLGQVPFPGGSIVEPEGRLPDPPHGVDPKVPRALSELILRLLAKNPADRWPSARAVSEALQTLQRQDTSTPPRPERWRGRRLLAALGSVVVLVGAWLAFSLGFSDKEMPATPRPEKRTASARPCHFALAKHYAVGGKPYAVAVGDLNGDGQPDLVVSNARDQTISVLLGHGDGTFQAAVPWHVGANPSTLVVADFNGDGHPDVAVAIRDENCVCVLLGQGDGTFRPARRFPTGTGPRGLALGDFNGDGKPDLATTDVGDRSVTILLGQGDGTFRPGPRLQASHLHIAIAVAVADFNGDGRQDLVVTNSGSNTLSLFWGNGDGTFRVGDPLPVGSGPGVVVVGDFNGDGHVDIAVENYGSNDVSVLLGNGDGTFGNVASYAAGVGPGGLALGDFNGDGIADLVVANHESHNLSFLVSKGDGAFRSADHFAVGRTPAGVAVADFNGDGRIDVVVVNHESHTVSVLLNQPPTPHFRLSTNYQLNGPGDLSVTVTALDAAHRVDTKYTGTAHWRFTDPKSPILEDLRFPASRGGMSTRSIHFRTAGLQTLTVSDAADPSRVGSVNVLVLAGPATQYRLDVPKRVRAGQEFAVTVTALDLYDNTADQYKGAVRFAAGGADAVLPGNYTFVSADGGRHTFPKLLLRKPGTHTLTVTDRDDPTFSASAHITVQQP